MSLAKHFMHPAGLGGRFAGWIMATRGSNVTRNRWVVDLLDIGPHDRVLEIGCGPGIATEAALARGAEVVAVDPSEVMRSMCARRNPGATVVAGDADHLPDGPFTVAFAVNNAQFWPDLDKALASLRDRVAVGGRVAIVHQPRHKGATDADARQIADENAARLVAAGFVDPRVEVLDVKPVAAGCALARVGL
jgi:trans-aconitate methyltransferase